MAHAPNLISIDMPPGSQTWRLRMYEGREVISEALFEDVDEMLHADAILLLDVWRREVAGRAAQGSTVDNGKTP